MPQDVYIYARYYQKPDVMKPGVTSDALTFIEQLSPRIEGQVIGHHFTFMEFRTAFYDSCLAAENPQAVNPFDVPALSALKERFKYLAANGYLARTREGWDHWEIMRGDRPLTLTSEGLTVREITVPKAPDVEHTGMSDEALVQAIEDAKTKLAKDTPDFDDLLSGLGFMDKKP